MPPAIIFNPFIFPSLFFLISSTVPTTISSPDYVYSICSNTTTFATNSSYQTNLNSVLTSLSSNSITQSGFNATAAWEAGPGTVYGIFLCRGDATEDVCSNCVATAVKALPSYCPNRKKAIIWYDVCMIRYSDEAFYDIVDVVLYMLNVNNITNNVTWFTYLLGDTMDNIAKTAAKGQSGKKFATAEANINSLQKLYTLAQCTPNLSSNNCYTCLTDCISLLPRCCSEKQGGRVLSGTCNIRYELYSFYENAAAAPTPAPAPVPASPTPLAAAPHRLSPAIAKKGSSTKVIVGIIAPIAIASVVLIIVGICLLNRKRKKMKAEAIEVIENDSADFKNVESSQYDLSTIKVATNNFFNDNKIGQGGFGGVYKGTLPNGQEVAVKRLCKSSDQGADEFKNEWLHVPRVRHARAILDKVRCI